MDEQEAGQFYIEPQEQQLRQVIEIEEPNPIYSKTILTPQVNPSFKMVEIQRNIDHLSYKAFKIQKVESGSEEEDQKSGELLNGSPFSQFYSQDQLIYQRYNNREFNKANKINYFSGTFLSKNVLVQGLQQSSVSYADLIEEFYEDCPPQIKREQADLVFDSNFESGNLFAVMKISDREYDLIMQNDNNSTGNNQWFYFTVEKMIPGAEYTFNVVNFTKSDSLFNYGMKPAIFSAVLNKKNGTGWVRAGKDVVYEKGPIPREKSKKKYYRLTFRMTWKISNDKISIAYTFPYTYTKVCQKIEEIIRQKAQFVSKITIGKTIAKKNIEVLIITNKVKVKKDSRKAIIIMARQHPGETQGSFVCEGVINRLLQRDCKQSEFLRKNYLIYVIPMVNPDGVIFGHYRTNLAGKDLNRKWDSTQKQVNCLEIVAIKNFIAEISKERQIRFILDLHGHSKKLNSFFYGNPMPQNPQLVRIYPYICSKMNPAVQFMDCSFATQEYKRKAARIFLSHTYKQIHVYTYEVSFYGYLKEGRKQEFTQKQLLNLGANLINCLFIFLENESISKVISKDSQYYKLVSEFKQDKAMLQVGKDNESGSESKPQNGEINLNEISDTSRLKTKKSVTSSIVEQSQAKSTKKMTSRKGVRDFRQIRQINKPVRTFKFLEISRVNSILPDRYQLGLQPIRKKEYLQAQVSRHEVLVHKISSHCQTEQRELIYQNFSTSQIEQFANLSGSLKVALAKTNEKRYSSLVKNARTSNNVIFKIDLNLNERCFSTANQKDKNSQYHAFSQTMISFHKFTHERNRSSQLFPIVDSLDSSRGSKRVSGKFQTIKIGLKRETEVFLNGMVKKFLIEKEQKVGANVERPLSIKRKQIYRK